MKLVGLHHITMITGEAQRNREHLEHTLWPVLNLRSARRAEVS